MALKIIKSTEPIRVERLNLCLYGPPGICKTSLAYTADAPLLLDFDKGSHRAIGRKDTVRIESWTEVADMKAEDLEGYNTVVVDTAGRALDALTVDIIKRNPKAGRGGALTLQGYGTLKAEFVAWLKQLNSFGKDVVMLAHMDEQRNGDDIIERLDVQGGSKGEIYKAADAMGRILIRDGRRLLNFNPTDAAFGKNPGQLEPLEIPRPEKMAGFLAGVTATIKERLNALTEEQAKAQEVINSWRAKISGMKTADAFNAALDDVKKQPKAVQAIFAEEATLAGLVFDKAAKQYAATAKEAA